MSTAITNGVHGSVLNNKKKTIHVSHMNNPFWTMDCLSDAARTGNLPLPQRAEQSGDKGQRRFSYTVVDTNDQVYAGILSGTGKRIERVGEKISHGHIFH